MSSTYSTDLRVQLMGTGDQAGTWGATTNNNFQYIFEQAIAGVQTVTLSTSPYALTYLNGATSTLANNQAIAAALIFNGGVSGGAATVTTPSGSQKLYIIYNNTTSPATSITLQVTGSGGNTIVVPAGVTTSVYTDGTNFYAANTGTVGAYVVNGALTVTGNASVGGNETITGTLSVTGTTTHTGAVALNGGGTSTTPTVGDNSTKIATTAFVQSALPLSTIYPVGSIYMNTSSTSPATLFGFGTWIALAAGQMLMGAGNGSYPAGSTGGSATTTIGLDNLPAHDHSITDKAHNHTYVQATGSLPQSGSSTNCLTSTTTANTGNAYTGITYTNTTQGNNSAFSNTAMTTISPYLVVYMWQRTA